MDMTLEQQRQISSQAVGLAQQMDHHEVQGQSNLFTGIPPPPPTLYCS